MALPSLLEQSYGFGERENMSMQAEQAGMRMFSAWRECEAWSHASYEQ